MTTLGPDKRPLTLKEYWGMVSLTTHSRNLLRSCKFKGRRNRRVEIPEYLYWDFYQALKDLDCLPDDAVENE